MPVNLTSRGKRKAQIKADGFVLPSAVSCALFFKRFEGKMGNSREAEEIWKKKLRKTRKNWGARWEQLRGGTQWITLESAAGRDTVDRAGVRCGAGRGGARCGEK